MSRAQFSPIRLPLALWRQCTASANFIYAINEAKKQKHREVRRLPTSKQDMLIAQRQRTLSVTFHHALLPLSHVSLQSRVGMRGVTPGTRAGGPVAAAQSPGLPPAELAVWLMSCVLGPHGSLQADVPLTSGGNRILLRMAYGVSPRSLQRPTQDFAVLLHVCVCVCVFVCVCARNCVILHTHTHSVCKLRVPVASSIYHVAHRHFAHIEFA